MKDNKKEQKTIKINNDMKYITRTNHSPIPNNKKKGISTIKTKRNYSILTQSIPINQIDVNNFNNVPVSNNDIIALIPYNNNNENFEKLPEDGKKSKKKNPPILKADKSKSISEPSTPKKINNFNINNKHHDYFEEPKNNFNFNNNLEVVNPNFTQTFTHEELVEENQFFNNINNENNNQNFNDFNNILDQPFAKTMDTNTNQNQIFAQTIEVITQNNLEENFNNINNFNWENPPNINNKKTLNEKYIAKKKEIAELKNELAIVKYKLSEKDNIIKQLEEKIKNKDNIIINYSHIINQNKFTINNLKNELNIKKNELKQKKNELEQIKYTYNLSDTKIILDMNTNMNVNVNFCSLDQKINCSISCHDSDIFATVEEKLYQKYPIYRERNNIFQVKGKTVLRFKTIKDNNIGNNFTVWLINQENAEIFNNKIIDNNFILNKLDKTIVNKDFFEMIFKNNIKNNIINNVNNNKNNNLDINIQKNVGMNNNIDMNIQNNIKMNNNKIINNHLNMGMMTFQNNNNILKNANEKANINPNIMNFSKNKNNLQWNIIENGNMGINNKTNQNNIHNNIAGGNFNMFNDINLQQNNNDFNNNNNIFNNGINNIGNIMGMY